ncbi:MAG: hypothetical protein J6S71_09500 [Clostridia bacterium]|nr:hypothetical protein [Clostridia bacterium]
MKKITITVLAVLLLLQVCVIASYVAAQSESKISLSSGQGYAGDTVELTVSVEDNTGFGSLELTVGFDKNVLEFVGAECEFSGGMAQFTPASAADGFAVLTYTDIENVTADGAVFTLIFRIKNGAPSGESPLTLSLGDGSFAYDGYDMKNFVATLNSGSVTVNKASTALLGDVDLDGDRDAIDLLILSRHNIGTELITGPEAIRNADINCDGSIDAIDLLILARHNIGTELIVP